MCTEKNSAHMGVGRVEGLAGADFVAMTPIGVSGNFAKLSKPGLSFNF